MRFITLDADNMVISVRYGETIVDGEIESELGECGQIKQTDGTFLTPEPPTPEPSEADYLLDLDYRVSKIELGL